MGAIRYLRPKKTILSVGFPGDNTGFHMGLSEKRRYCSNQHIYLHHLFLLF